MKPLLIFILIIYFCSAYSQESTKISASTENKAGNFLCFGAGIIYRDIYDEAIAPMHFQKTGIAPALGFLRTSNKTINRIEITGSYLKLTSQQSRELIASAVLSIKARLGYSHLRKIKSLPYGINWYGGGSLKLMFDLKQAPQLDNSAIIYDYALSLGARTAFQKELHWKKRNPVISLTLDLPVLSHISRPPYLNRIEFIDPKNDLLKDFIQESEITSLNDLFGINTLLELYYPISSGNQLRLSYDWDFYRMKTFNKVIAADHFISFSLLMKV